MINYEYSQLEKDQDGRETVIDFREINIKLIEDSAYSPEDH